MHPVIYIGILILAVCCIWLAVKLWHERRTTTTVIRFTELILKNIDAYILLIDPDFNVLQTNYYVATGTQPNPGSRKVGNMLHCKNGEDAGECGTHELCASCPVRQAITKAFHQRESFSNLQAAITLYTTDDRTSSVDCEVSVTGIYLKIEDNEQLLLTIHDITAIKQIEHELNEALLHAEESDRMKSLFLDNTTHEIRTPLNAIIGFSELLAGTPSPEEKQEYIRIIRTNSNSLLQLVNDTLDLAQIQDGTFEYTYSEEELNDIMEALEGICRRKQTGNNIRIGFKRLYPSCHIHTDRKRLMQIMLNFLTNAMKFTTEGEIVFGFEIRGETLYFYVRDTGIGISDAKMQLLFRRFVQADSHTQGFGIGLTICKSIAEAMGGKIGVESEEGKGSTFWFTLPYVQS